MISIHVQILIYEVEVPKAAVDGTDLYQGCHALVVGGDGHSLFPHSILETPLPSCFKALQGKRPVHGNGYNRSAVNQPCTLLALSVFDQLFWII